MAPENQAQAQQSSGSFWMPLMAGYMMGRLMGGGAGFAQQPLFSSKTRPALHTANIPMRQVKLRRGATGPDNDRTENRDGAETCHHNNRYPAVLANPSPNRAPCSVALPVLQHVRWAADTHGKSQYYRAPGLAR